MKINKHLLREQLLKDFNECSFVGWDSYNAQLISEVEYKKTLEFLESWPEDIAQPQITPDYDACFDIEWYSKKGIVNLFDWENKHYAMMYDENDNFETIIFEGEFPERLHNRLKEIANENQ